MAATSGPEAVGGVVAGTRVKCGQEAWPVRAEGRGDRDGGWGEDWKDGVRVKGVKLG